MTGRALVAQADAIRLPLRDESVHLVVTSPPYLWKRKYAIDGAGEMGNEANWRLFLDNLWAATDEMLRVLKPSGSIFVNLGDTRVTSRESKWLGIPPKSRLLIPERYRIGCQDRYANQGVIVRQVQIWEKANGLPEAVTDRTRDTHEDWVQIVKRPNYYSAVDEIRTPSSGYVRHNGVSRATPGGQRPRMMADTTNPLGALPGSVWTVPSEPLRLPAWLGIAHYAAFPGELVRRLVLAFSPPGICVACGEGRWPVVDRPPTGGFIPDPSDKIAGASANGAERNRRYREHLASGEKATILGYACRCTPYTDHPGTAQGVTKAAPGSHGIDPRDTWVGIPVGERERVGPWREYHLAGWAPPPTRPAVVLDPFGGVGTTAMVARALGRVGLSFDLSMPYSRAARWRVTSDHAAKAISRTNRERQGSLL